MKRFCVVGDKGSCSARVNRTWFDTLEQAEEHAKELARRSYEENAKPVHLNVVEIKSSISLGMPEIQVNRWAD